MCPNRKQATSTGEFWSLNSRLFILLIVTVLPFIAFSVYKAINIHDKLRQQAHDESLKAARDVAHDIDECIVSTVEFLIPIANNNDVRTQNYEIVDGWLKSIKQSYPYYSNIIFVDVDGNIQAAARDKDKPGSGKVNVSDTAYFKRAMKSDGPAIGDFVHGKISDNPVVHVTYPVYDLSDKKIGFVAAAFDLTRVQEKLMYANIPYYMLIGVLDSNGIMIARSSEPEKWVGKDHSKLMGFKEMIGKTEGLGRTINPDGSSRIYAFAATSKVSWYIRAGIDSQYINKQVRAELINHFLAFIPFLLLAIAGWLWIGKDVNKLHRKVELLSLTDPLTGLWNFRKLEQDFDREVLYARRYKEKLSFAMIDIDHFKHYNDRNGHQLGDSALRAVANAVIAAVRDVDTVYRCGGEELCVLLPNTDKDGAFVVAERIRRSVESKDIIGGENQPLGRLTVSIGVATYPLDSISKDGLANSADTALYKAKNKGRNRVETASSNEENVEFRMMNVE